jgi:hypothetical protein
MWALEVFTIYVTPFLILGAVLRLIVKRDAVDRQPKAQISPLRRE